MPNFTAVLHAVSYCPDWHILQFETKVAITCSHFILKRNPSVTKTISIALATYNGAKYLQALLDSLANQSYLPAELVVSDDNSTDETCAIVEAFAKVAPFEVKLIQNTTQLGVLDNFAVTLNNTTKDLIAYCDQDDIWASDKLEKCVGYFDNPEVKLVMHRSEVVDSKLQPLGFSVPNFSSNDHGENPFPSYIDMNIGLGHQMLFDGKLYRDFTWVFKHKYPSLMDCSENYDNQFRFLAGLSGSIIILSDILVKFRRHESAASDAALQSNQEATTSGFINKSPKQYFDKASTLEGMYKTLEEEVLEQMPDYKTKLQIYIKFLKNRAKLYHLRAVIYEDNPIWTRYIAYLKLIYKLAYRKKSKRGMGHKALLVDFFVATCSLKGAKRLVAKKQGVSISTLSR